MLNVTSESTNIYYYSDFPLVTLNKTGYKILRNVPIKGSHAFAILNDLVLFSHGYDHRAVVYLYSLRDNKRKTFQTVNQNGQELKYDYAVGRGSKLFLVKDKDVYLIKRKMKSLWKNVPKVTGARVKDPAAIPRQLFLVELTGVEKGMMGNS